MSDLVIIAVDAMGGDSAPDTIVRGSLEALAEYDDISIQLVGREDALRPLLETVPDRLRIVPASQVVGMNESPGAALRKKKDSSIAVCAALMKKREVAALVSAGNTGAVIAASMFAARLLPGVLRPGIAVVFPTVDNKPTILCDVGANIRCKPEHYLQYGIMGSAYARHIFGIESPRVGLLNIGTEETKGSAELKAVRAELERAASQGILNFVGGVEGNHVFEGEADVVICDGFTGNILLKSAEGVADAVVQRFARFVSEGEFSPDQLAVLQEGLTNLYEFTHYAEYGGAPLLGIDGCAVVAHGRSDARAIKHAIRVARNFARSGLNQQISARLRELSDLPKVALP